MSTLTKSKGNMYDWVTHTHTHLRGECPHGCKYCYVQAMERRYNGGHYKGELRLDESSLSVDYGKDKIIFIDNCNDLFAEDVNEHWIEMVLDQCKKYPLNKYVFQSKNPRRMICYLKNLDLDYMAGTTIETDVNSSDVWDSCCPSVLDRFKSVVHGRKYIKELFVTVEPILYMSDPLMFANMIHELTPDFVNIGADSKGTGLHEPNACELRMFISELQRLGVNIRKKVNLDRLLKGGD